VRASNKDAIAGITASSHNRAASKATGGSRGQNTVTKQNIQSGNYLIMFVGLIMLCGTYIRSITMGDFNSFDFKDLIVYMYIF
jgi:hypothetical protein